MEKDNHESVLVEAQRLVHGARNETYGDPIDDYTRTVNTFKSLMGDKKISEMTAEDGIIFMICVKLSREVNSPKRDNNVDGAGYFECLEWTKDERALRDGKEQRRDSR